MTFDLSAEQSALAVRARAVAESVVAPLAASVDATGAMPDAVIRAVDDAGLAHPLAAGAVAATAVLEELAVASAGVATAIGMASLVDRGMARPEAAGAAWSGLRGGATWLTAVSRAGGTAVERARLLLSAVATGVGRAAVAEAVAFMTQRGLRPSGDETTPHWLLADAATEVEAARLLTLQAAQMVDRGEAAGDAIVMARGYAAAAARRAVDAAMSIAGSDSDRQGATLERLSRDARTLTLVLGTPEPHRASGARDL